MWFYVSTMNLRICCKLFFGLQFFKFRLELTLHLFQVEHGFSVLVHIIIHPHIYRCGYLTAFTCSSGSPSVFVHSPFFNVIQSGSRFAAPADRTGSRVIRTHPDQIYIYDGKSVFRKGSNSGLGKRCRIWTGTGEARTAAGSCRGGAGLLSGLGKKKTTLFGVVLNL